MLVLDGGTGDELRRLLPDAPWSPYLLESNPDQVVATHERFVEAGADVIETWNYSVTPYWLKGAKDVERLTRLSVELAKRAVGETDRVLIAGSVPPLGATREMDKCFDQEVRETYDMITKSLEGVDLFLIESCPSIRRARMAFDSCKKADPDKPVWISFTMVQDRLVSQEPIRDLKGWLAGQHIPDAVLFNCCSPDGIRYGLQEVRDMGYEGLTGGYANMYQHEGPYGLQQAERQAELGPDRHACACSRNVTPDQYAKVCRDWADLGAGVVGGCCGFTPQHIRALRDAFPKSSTTVPTNPDV